MSVTDKLNPLNSVATIADSVATGLDELFTSDEERLQAKLLLQKELQQPHILQAMTNLEEAKNPNLFVSGWRPALGWLCVVLLAYSWIGRDLIVIGFDLLPESFTEIQVSQTFESTIDTADKLSDEINALAHQGGATADNLKLKLDQAETTLKTVVQDYWKTREYAAKSQGATSLQQKLPELDSGAIMSLVLALLGLGATRTYEKVSGVARTRWRDTAPTGASATPSQALAPAADNRTDFSDDELEEAFYQPSRKRKHKRGGRR